jgi:hypothetical protein
MPTSRALRGSIDKYIKNISTFRLQGRPSGLVVKDFSGD